MDAEILQGFVKQTEEYLPLVRGGILICAQAAGGVYGEFSASVRQIGSIRNSASVLGLDKIETACADFERELKLTLRGAANDCSLDDEEARRLLDRLAAIEVLVAEIYFGAGDFSDSVSNFVEEYFEQFEPNRNDREALEKMAEEQFEIDAEMLEVFALEADDIVRNFKRNLELLEKSPTGSGEALPEMRRSAHTLKGSAGVVGLKILSEFAHRVEDLLDCIAENQISGSKKIFELLLAATDCFEALAAGETSLQLTKKIERIYENIDAALLETKNESSAERGTRSAEFKSENQIPKAEERVQNSKSIVRVSLDRLDELVKIADDLRVNRSIFERRFDEQDLLKNDNLESLFERQLGLIEEIQEKLLRLRMVRFGSLSARLQRTVRAACEEEEKLAELFVEGEDLEIDTQILDGFVEPLLHLLRNAVAHGIEAPDLRRLLGKPETGKIRLRASIENSRVVVSVSDDGRGISADALREKAVAAGFISRNRAEQMSDAEAFELTFLNGLTTAEILSQTAGRGVGMNVVKRSVERQSGTISIESEARKGTTFTVYLPTLSLPRAECLSVLIVDDSPSIRQSTDRLIKRAGWNSQTAENGLAALEILSGADRLPDIILTDLEMPRMDGYEFLASLKGENSLRAIPVVMITSQTSDEYRRKAVDLGASEFMTKPFDEMFLVNKIKNLTRLA